MMTPSEIKPGPMGGGWLLSLVLVLIMGGLAFVAVNAQRSRDVPLGFPRPLAPFEWIDQRGQKVTLEQLKGTPWVAAFFFTRCSLTCPQLMQAMGQLQQQLKDHRVKLVAFSVQSSHDTPAILNQYAQSLGADPDRWLFLTGEESALHRFVQEQFLATVAVDQTLTPDLQVAHSNRFYLVDAQGQVRFHREVVASADPVSNRPPFVVKTNEVRWVLLRAMDLERGGLIGLSDLPMINAFLNSTSLIMLMVGGALIRLKKFGWHAALMLSACAVSSLFLFSYLYYHAHAGDTVFPHTGALRWTYLTILISHVFLAIATVPLVLITLFFAWRSSWARHRRWARWTWPIWLYVSLTGILVYCFLYELFPTT